MGKPAYTRLDVDERRRLLLQRGRELFTTHAYDELTMAQIAREAGISKALLYHYFPSKQAYFAATLQEAAGEIAARVIPDPSLPANEQLVHALDAWLEWIDENRVAYAKLMRSAPAVPEVRDLVAAVRDGTAATIVSRLTDTPTPQLRAGVRGWLWFMDGVCLDWAEHADLTRAQLRELLTRTLQAATGGLATS